jgi:hypothetical protein
MPVGTAYQSNRGVLFRDDRTVPQGYIRAGVTSTGAVINIFFLHKLDIS